MSGKDSEVGGPVLAGALTGFTREVLGVVKRYGGKKYLKTLIENIIKNKSKVIEAVKLVEPKLEESSKES